MTITLITGGFIGLWHLILSWNVVSWRRSTKTANGLGEENSKLYRASRAQGNNAEYAPLILILIAALDYMNASNYMLVPLAVLFVIGRILHGYGLGYTDGSVSFYRMVGTLLTWSTLGILSIACLVIGYGVA